MRGGDLTYPGAMRSFDESHARPSIPVSRCVIGLTAFVCGVSMACGGGGGRRAGADASAPGTDASVVLPDGAVVFDASVPDSATPGTDAGPPPTPLSFCQLGCTAAANCTTASAAFDADNYRCDTGRCVYTGCNDDAECQSTFARSDYGCRSVDGLSTCVQTCVTSASCGTATSAAFDADNYRCDTGRCVYTGCNGDAECAATFSDPRYVCRAVVPPSGGLPVPEAAQNCVLGCTVASDCSSPSAAFDADNYECIEGACHYTGCNADAECASTFSDVRYICR